MIYATREEQQIAEACKGLIKNAIICWNYLYLSQKIRKQPDLVEKQQLLRAVKASSIIAWRHIYFHGFYDFSDEKLTDSLRVANPQNQHLGLNINVGSVK